MKLLAFIIPLFLIGCGDVQNHYSENYEDAKNGIELGWLPAWLPVSMTEIHESHNIDTNEVYARFKPNTEINWVPATCIQKGIDKIDLPRRKPKWWTENIPESNSQNLKYVYFQCSEIEFLAVTKIQNYAYYWSN